MAHRIRLRRRRRTRGGFAVSAVIAGLILAAAVHGHAPAGLASTTTAARAAAAIAFARCQLGKPYLRGGAGPGAFDCSGLVMAAYAAAEVAIPRTSQEQWAAGPQVTTPEPGDLVFFAGADGTPADPGHVGLVVDQARHLMIEAYAAGYPVRVSQFGTSGSAPGDTDPAAFTDPAGGG